MVGSKRLDQDVYERNIRFWDRAWSPVKAPYTQMPDLPYIQALPARLAGKGTRTVLDLGCGSGWLSIYLARAGFCVTGMDIAARAVELANQWALQEPNIDARFIAGDITQLDTISTAFDACVANSIFEHLTFDLAATTLDKLKQALKPGGILFACFDQVGTGPGEYYRLDDGTHVYTDRARDGMLLHYFNDADLRRLLSAWTIESLETLPTGSRLVFAQS